MDIQIEVGPVDFDALRENSTESESSEAIRARVNAARAYSRQRCIDGGTAAKQNSDMTTRDIEKYCILSDDASALLKAAFDALGMSARGYDKILRLSRTIADLDGSETITARHISEAIKLRSLDKKYFNQ